MSHVRPTISRRTLLAGAATTASAAVLVQPSRAAASADPVRLGEPLRDVNLIGAAVTTTPDGVPAVYGAILGEPATLVAVHAHTFEVRLTHPLPGAGRLVRGHRVPEW